MSAIAAGSRNAQSVNATDNIGDCGGLKIDHEDKEN